MSHSAARIFRGDRATRTVMLRDGRIAESDGRIATIVDRPAGVPDKVTQADVPARMVDVVSRIAHVDVAPSVALRRNRDRGTAEFSPVAMSRPRQTT